MKKASTNTYNQTQLYLWREGGTVHFHEKNVAFEHWNNIRFQSLPYPDKEHYTTVDVRKGLPYSDHTFDAIYAYHISEHLTWHENIAFTHELYRVLRPGGVCRLSTPDLHLKAVDYLHQVKQNKIDPSIDNRKNYYWSVYGLIDQLARVSSGGEMLKALRSGFYNESYIKDNYGDVHMSYISEKQNRRDQAESKGLEYYIYAIYRKLITLFSNDKHRIYIENERFYFDDISYKRLMHTCAFVEVTAMTYNTSSIPHWDVYMMDTSEHGDYPLEPSCFVEGKKTILKD
ncbi:MAG: methyltransferase domain-containing protein [Saprospiraceae bacterium]